MTRRELNWLRRRSAGWVMTATLLAAGIVYGFIFWTVYLLLRDGLVP